MARKTDADRLYENAITAAKYAAGGERAFWIVGPTLRTALVAAEILCIADQQDDEVVPDSRVRALIRELRFRMIDDTRLQA